MTDEPLQWASPLIEAATSGPEAVRSVAEKLRAERTAEEADQLGVRLLALLKVDLAEEVTCIFEALEVLAGPRTIAAAGALVRSDPNCTRHSARYALSVLRESRTAEGVIQLALCARGSTDAHMCAAASALYEVRKGLLMHLADSCCANVPAEDLEQFLRLHLERGMLDGMRWRLPDFERAMQSNAHQHLRRVVWARFVANRPTQPFMLDPDGNQMITTTWEPKRLPPTSVVGVVHPFELPFRMWEQFGVFLGDFELVELFSQFRRDALAFEAKQYGYEHLNVPADGSVLLPFLFAEGWQFVDKGKFRFAVRGARLDLDFATGLEERRRLLTLTYVRSERAAVHTQIVLAELGRARAALLEAFAPELSAK